MSLPREVNQFLRTASMKRAGGPAFKCEVFPDPKWNQFVETWLPNIYTFVAHALGPYGREPLPEILKLPDGMHMSGATASFDMQTGQVRISTSVQGNPGQTLEKLTHEFVHGSLADFPSTDCFYDEGFVDYSTWVLAHAPVYEPFRERVIAAASFNIKMRRERAMRNLSDYDRKRWAGGTFASFCLGPMILHRLRMKKAEGDFTW